MKLYFIEWNLLNDTFPPFTCQGENFHNQVAPSKTFYFFNPLRWHLSGEVLWQPLSAFPKPYIEIFATNTPSENLRKKKLLKRSLKD